MCHMAGQEPMQGQYLTTSLPAPEEIDPAPRIFFASDCVGELWGEYTDLPDFQGATQFKTAWQKSELQGPLQGVL